MRRDYTLSNCDIIFSLLETGHSYQCERCERGMHVRNASGLCVWCYNEQRAQTRTPQVTRTIKQRASKTAPSTPTT